MKERKVEEGRSGNQEAVADEDRSRKIMVFEVNEETGEDLSDKISTVFEEISEKPSFEAARIGKIETGKVKVSKVSLRSFTIRVCPNAARNFV